MKFLPHYKKSITKSMSLLTAAGANRHLLPFSYHNLFHVYR